MPSTPGTESGLRLVALLLVVAGLVVVAMIVNATPGGDLPAVASPGPTMPAQPGANPIAVPDESTADASDREGWVGEPAVAEALVGQEAGQDASAENEPARLLEAAAALLNREDFVAQLVASQVPVAPSGVYVDATVAEKAYWCLVHVLAGEMDMWMPSPEALRRRPALAADLATKRAPYVLRTSILKDLMPELPRLLREKRIELTIEDKGRVELVHGNIGGRFVGNQVHESYSRMRLTLQRGRWAVRLRIPSDVVQPEMWANWVEAQKKQFGSPR